tara:strand:- start:74 stop:511 length:438 start_codon:yes stop_codon:yes gene_type:complete
VLQLSTTLVHISQVAAVVVVTLPETAPLAAVLAAVGNLELLRWVPQAQMAIKEGPPSPPQAAVLVAAALPALLQEGLRELRADTYYPDQAVLVAIIRVVGRVVLADQAITQADRVLRVIHHRTQVALWILQAAVVAGEQVAGPTG